MTLSLEAGNHVTGRDGQRADAALVVSGLDQPSGLTFDPSGRLEIAEEGANRVVRIEGGGAHTSILANVQRLRWLALGPDGTLYISARAWTSGDTDADAPESQVILRQSSAGALTVLADGFSGLQGLAVHDHVVYAAATGRANSSLPGGAYAITVLADGSAGGVALVGTPGTGQQEVALAVDARAAIFATASAPAVSARGVLKLGTSGGVARFAVGLADPEGLAFDADGHLFVADGSAGRVLKLHAPKPPVFGAVPAYTNVSPLSVALTTEPGTLVVVDGAGPVAGTADAQGSVELALPLTANAATTLEAWAIGRGGDGLASRAIEATVVHDDVAPTLDWPSPISGTAAGTSAAIRVRAADAVSGVASIRVTVDSRPLSVTSTPSLPARSVTAMATWEGDQVTDGVHTVTVTASRARGGHGPAAARPGRDHARHLTVATDAHGNFLMLEPPVGEQVVLIDGDPAGNVADRYPTIPVSMTIVANQLNELPYLPHLHRQHQRFTPIHRTQKTVATDPALPGVALHLEGGNDVIGWDGQRADKVSIRTVPADRLPIRPLPAGVRATTVYMFYFGKRGGGIPQRPMPFEGPSELGLAPGEQAQLWYFDESPRKGEAPNDWRIAWPATVSEDRRTIPTNPRGEPTVTSLSAESGPGLKTSAW